MKKYEILTICGAGVGSSNFIKMNVEETLEELGIRARVQNVGLSRAKATRSDLIITSPSFKNDVEEIGSDVIVVKNLFDKKEIKEKLEEYFKEKE